MVKAMQTKVGHPGRKLVLLKLADNASDSGECWPSYEHIANECEMTKRSVINYIKQLEKDGFLWVEKRKVKANQNLTNVYHLTLEVRKNSSEPHSLGSEPHSLGVVNHVHPEPVNIEPVNEPIRNKQKNSSSQIQKPTNVSQQVWKDFLSQRKTKLTETALKGIITQAEKAGWSLEQALTESIERGWQSFKAEWVIPKQNGFSLPVQKQAYISKADQEMEAHRQRLIGGSHV
jgi:DNA-binding transcriptional regulator YhcF (GntR family)